MIGQLTTMLTSDWSRSTPELLAVALQDATRENLKVALTSAKKK